MYMGLLLGPIAGCGGGSTSGNVGSGGGGGGGAGYPGTPPRSYAITVNATVGSNTHSAQAMPTVQ
jgi:hypothetical protein